MRDALDALDQVSERVTALGHLATGGRGKYLYPSDVQPITRGIASTYFETVREDLLAVQNRAGLVEEIDSVIQNLLQLSGAMREKQAYVGHINELRPYLLETLRDVIDHLAPDDKVAAVHGFQLEQGQTKPTQRQKVRFILRARRSPGAAVAVAEASLETVEEAVAGLARSTYQRSSASTHVGSSGKEIRNLKRYVDALLAELLEIS